MDILVIMRILTLPTLIGMAFMGISSLHAEDIQSERGKVFRNCNIISKDKVGVTFRHDGGVARVAYSSMPSAQQKHYGYVKPQKKTPVKVSQSSGSKATVSHGTTSKTQSRNMYLYRSGNRYIAAYASGGASHQHNGTYGYGYARAANDTGGVIKGQGAQRILRVNNPFKRTVSLQQIINYRNNGYSNITYEGLYNQHFNAHSSSHYRGARNNIVQAPRYLPYVRNIYPRQIGTYNVGPSGGSLVPAIRSGYSTAGSIAPSLVPARR